MRLRSQRLVSIFASTAAAALLAHCAPNNAEEIRELRPTTLGYLGGMYRPNGMMAFGLSLNLFRGASLSPSTTSTSDSDNRSAKISSAYGIDPYVHYYPWKTSAFFVGGGLNYNSEEVEWQEHTTAYTTAKPTFTQVKYSDSAVYLHIPVGWAWIWESGFTLSLDFGPSLRVTHTTSYSETGTNVDLTRRNDYADKIGNHTLGFGGTGIIGYSF